MRSPSSRCALSTKPNEALPVESHIVYLSDPQFIGMFILWILVSGTRRIPVRTTQCTWYYPGGSSHYY